MRILGTRDLLTPEELAVFHRGALRIIDRVGMQIENDEMLSHLADFGGRVDKASRRVTFAPEFVEQFLASREREAAPVAGEPQLACEVGGYSLNYEDPETLEVRRFTTRDFIDAARLCDSLPYVKYVAHVGVPGDIPPMLLPLELRFLLWRHTERAWGNTYMVWDTRLCPYIWELCQIRASMEGRKMYDVLRPTNFMVSPLRYPREEAEQFVWFWKKGHYFNIAHMLSMGGSAPVTLPGAVVLWLAESLMLNIIAAAFFARKGLYMGASITPLDMRRGTYSYGRPESSLAELAAAQLVRRYAGGSGGGAGGASNAKGVDYEAGLQCGCAPILDMAFNGGVGTALALYSNDEVFSPIKLVIDMEYLDHLLRLARPMEVTEESLALDVIEEVGPGGVFTGTMHTAEHFREEIWHPKLFSWENWESWCASGRRPLADKAREVVRAALADHHPRGIKPEVEKALRKFIDKARPKLVE